MPTVPAPGGAFRPDGTHTSQTQLMIDGMMEDNGTRGRTAPPMSMTRFFAIWAGQAFSLIGSQLVQFALVWWLTQQTGSATMLALAMMMAVLPQVVISPFAGAVIDRWKRRTVMIVADAVVALGVVVLAALYALDAIEVWHVYALMFVRAAGGAFHWPATQASTTLMVPERHLSRIAGLNQALYGVANILSPPLGALLLAYLPMQGVLAVDVTTAALAILPLLFIRIPEPRRLPGRPGASPVRSVLVDLGEGLSFLRGWAGIMMVMVLAMIVNLLLTPAMSLQPLLITNHFRGGAIHLAWLQSAFGVGLVAGGITLSVWGGSRRRLVTGLTALVLMGVGVLGVGLVPGHLLILAVAAMFFAGFMSPIANGSLFALLQATVPPEIQGRVFTLMLSGTAAMSPLGLLIAGPLADLLGIQAWFRIAGAAMCALGVGAYFVRGIRRVEEEAAQRSAALEERRKEAEGVPILAEPVFDGALEERVEA